MIAGEPFIARPALPPTRARFKVTGLVLALGMITYLDRACIATLAPDISAEFSLSKVQMGYVFSAFALAYAIFEIPTARLLDRRGARKVLTRIVAWWSAFTLATGAAAGYASLLVTRFLFGVGEAGAWPGVARTFARWIPRTERGRAQGLFFASAHFAGGVTPYIVVKLLPVLSWRGIFFCFGLLGVLWAAAWHTWFRDEPADHPAVNEAELAHIIAGREVPVPPPDGWTFWKSLLGNRSLLALCVMYFPNSFIFYFCITWLPTYLREQHGFATQTLVFFTGLPLILSVFADMFGGLTTDWLTARFGLRVGRCGVGGMAYLIAGSALLLTPLAPQPMLAASLIAIATAASMFSLAAAWGSCIDLGQENAAVVSAAMNTSGAIGSFLCPLIVAYSLKWYASWNVSIYLMGVLFLIGAAAWCVIQPHQRIFPSAESAVIP
jgi:ACS family glucarate transporter-like MFS transporter